MSDRLIERATLMQRVNHLLMAGAFFVLFMTGLGFAYSSLGVINALMGGPGVAQVLHRWGGVLFLITLIYSVGSYLPECLSFGPEDRDWLYKRGGYFGSVTIMEQEWLNLGQKVFYLLVLVAGLAMGLSGLVLWLMVGNGLAMQAGLVAHMLAFAAYCAIVPVHVYIVSLATPGALRVITKGTVPAKWARRHHGKWAKEAEEE